MLPDLLRASRARPSSACRWLVIAFIVCFSHFADARQTLVVVSDRSLAPIVAGAHRVIDGSADIQFQIRSVTQLQLMAQSEFQQLLDTSDTVAFFGVFGEPIERLLQMRYPEKQYRVVLHSDHRLDRLSTDSQGKSYPNGLPEALISESSDVGNPDRLAAVVAEWPEYRDWLRLRAYWLNRNVANVERMLSVLSGVENVAPPEDVAPLRFALHSNGQETWLSQSDLLNELQDAESIVWIVDHNTGDLGGEWALHRAYCQQLSGACVSVMADWGAPSVKAIDSILSIMSEPTLQERPTAVVALQDFVIGGGDGREAVKGQFEELGVPIIKGIRLDKWSLADYQLSTEGMPKDSVHYRVAMPELQGVSQPQVVALSSEDEIDRETGAALHVSTPQTAEVQRQVKRIERWLALQKKDNADKRVAIVYYNHPPGRHNIGADNLNVPDSLLEILQAMQKAGYKTGELPKTSAELLELLQAKGVNLPEDSTALADMAESGTGIAAADYQAWFDELPAAVQAEMENGPLGALEVKLEAAVASLTDVTSVQDRQSRVEHLQHFSENTIADLHHAVDGLRHEGRERALDLLDQLEHSYTEELHKVALGETADWSHARALSDALLAMQIEGIRGWGAPPGRVMVWDNKLLIPGLTFGNVFIGPQPPRGWEINEELLHANLSFPPPHQYLAFYQYIQSIFKADAVVHLGRHSTYEFLPKRSVGLSEEDYPSIVAGDLPGVYPYIVDGVGEGTAAKRRGLAVMVDHLTPPLAATEIYDNLLQLRQLIESAEAATDPSTRERAIESLRRAIDDLDLRDELVASMDEELTVRGVGFDAIDDEFLLHETGHYLTKLQESFMPLGLHTFGRDWDEAALQTMLASMAQGSDPDADELALWRTHLAQSPSQEMTALLAGLEGRFVAPGKGNDPIRTPEALPTGRNFHSLDGSLLPTRVGYDIGSQLAEAVLEKHIETETDGGKQAVILWASDAVRDEGAMIAFGMRLLGVRPVWNSRGIIKGLERLPLDDTQPRRLDVLFNTSGLFRDLYGSHLVLLDKASLLALDASADVIKRDYPALFVPLEAALRPLDGERLGGEESLDSNRVAANWVAEASRRLAEQPEMNAEELGRESSLRVFGIAPGSYGAGINRMAERSSSWDQRDELSDVFIQRMGHVFGSGLSGEPSQALFREQLAGVTDTYLGRASHLYGLMDNNDAFDYLGGLNMAVESVSGKQPQSSVINHADNANLRIDQLPDALLRELRSRYLNPQWIKPLMEEGYAGARTMGSEFMEYLWGWQVTSPHIINDRVWEEVKSVYVDDSLDLGLDEFLSEDYQQQVQTNMLAIMLVAIDKGFWDADEETVQQLSQQFADNILTAGIPGSGHTHADHPMYELVKANVDAETATALAAVLAQARLPESPVDDAPSHIQELNAEAVKPESQPADLTAEPSAQGVSGKEPSAEAVSGKEPSAQGASGKEPSAQETSVAEPSEEKNTRSEENSDDNSAADSQPMLWFLGCVLVALLAFGFWRGRRAT